MTLILPLLRCPDHYELENKSKVTALEALVISLCRLRYPNRLCDLVEVFGRSSSMLSRISNIFLKDVQERSCNILQLLSSEYIDCSELANAVRRATPLANCIGFLDGTVRPIARPSNDQEAVYNGHKRTHALKYQSLMLANGIIIIDGPFEGRRHDSFLLRESGLMQRLRELPLSHDGSRYLVYGDPAYALQQQVICPYPTVNITQEQQLFNENMSKVRQSVEYGFGKVLQNFSFVDYKKKSKTLSASPRPTISLCCAIYKHTYMYVWIYHEHFTEVSVTKCKYVSCWNVVVT